MRAPRNAPAAVVAPAGGTLCKLPDRLPAGTLGIPLVHRVSFQVDTTGAAHGAVIARRRLWWAHRSSAPRNDAVCLISGVTCWPIITMRWSLRNATAAEIGVLAVLPSTAHWFARAILAADARQRGESSVAGNAAYSSACATTARGVRSRFSSTSTTFPSRSALRRAGRSGRLERRHHTGMGWRERLMKQRNSREPQELHLGRVAVSTRVVHVERRCGLRRADQTV